MGDTLSTEDKILKAAEEVFQERGYHGARMREIAEKAGINKGLLHYYFKSKEKLFDAIFSVAIGSVLGRISGILDEEIPLGEKIDRIVDQYMNFFLKNPNLPRFVLNELNKNANHFVIKGFSGRVRETLGKFRKTILEEEAKGKIRYKEPEQIMLNIVGMILIPFVGRPLIQTAMGLDNASFKKLLEERKEHIKEFIKQGLQP